MNDAQLKLQIALLRTTLRIVLQCLRHGDAKHIMVDAARPNLGLGKYIRRVLEDTK